MCATLGFHTPFLQPKETLLVADAATGQQAVSVAKTFHEAIGITGIVLTKLDGDARGGATRYSSRPWTNPTPPTPAPDADEKSPANHADGRESGANVRNSYPSMNVQQRKRGRMNCFGNSRLFA